MIRLSLENLFARKFRLLSTSISVLIGVAFLAGSMILIDTLGSAFDDLVTDINEGVDVVVRSSNVVETDFNSVRARVDESITETIRGVDGVGKVEPFVQGYAQLVDQRGEAIGNPGQGAPTIGVSWTVEPELSQLTIVEGAAPSSPRDIVVDRQTASENDLQVGDTVMVLLQVPPEEFTISGLASFGETDSLLGASLTAFELGTAERVLGEPGKVDLVSVAGDGSVEQDELRDRIDAVLTGDLEAITGEESIDEAQEDIATSLGFFNTFMTAFAVIALFVAAFIIYNTFSILVAHRTRETALMRALGAGRRQVIGSVLMEAAFVGLIASALGLVGGLAIAEVLRQLLDSLGFSLPPNGLVFEASTAYYGLVVGIGITMVSATIPAFRASRVAPMAALRQSSIDDMGAGAKRLLFGVLTLAGGVSVLFWGLFGSPSQRLATVGLGAAAVFVGVAALGPVVASPFVRVVGAPLARLRGLPGELAQDNSMRNPKRTATTAAALMIGVGLVSAISIFASSTSRSVDKIIDQTVVGDLVIDSGSQGFGGLSPALATEIAALDEVAVASGVRMVLTEVDGDAEELLAFDTTNMTSLIDVDIQRGSPADLGATSIAVLDTEAQRRGWTIGSEVDVHFVETGTQTFTVDMLYAEDRLVGDMFISNVALEANVADVFDFAIYLLRNDSFSSDEFRRAVERTSAPYPNADVQNLEEVKAGFRDQIDQMLTLVYALLGLAIVIALIGIANTLALSIVERTREIGLLRALGMTRSQLRATVRWESFLIALLGTALGLILGAFFGWSLVEALSDEGITELVIDPTTMVVVAIVACLSGVVASIRPASKAAKLAVLDAIATE